MKRQLHIGVTLGVILTLMMTVVAKADNILADGDGVTPVGNNDLAFGTICTGSTTTANVPIVIRRLGSGVNVFKDGSTVVVSVQATTGAGLSASADGPSQIHLPHNWGALTNNTDSDVVWFTVQLIASGPNPSYSGSVTFRGSGLNASNNPLNRDDVMGVTANVVDCTPSDTTPPVITPNVSGTLGNNGWYVSDVTVSWTVEDDESAISSSSGCDDTTIDYDTTGQELTCEATSAGGTSSESVTIKRDATAPAVAVTGVADGATYTLGAVPAADCDTTDATSGVAADATLSSSGGPVGTVTATCSGALDNAGNPGSASATYYVHYNWNGFFRPVDNPPVLNVVKAGSAIPVKFSLSGNQGLSIFAAGYPRSVPISCDAWAPTDDVAETVNAGGSSLSYDADADQYVYVWKTDKAWAGTCRQLQVMLNDGTTHYANFQFKK